MELAATPKKPTPVHQAMYVQASLESLAARASTTRPNSHGSTRNTPASETLAMASAVASHFSGPSRASTRM